MAKRKAEGGVGHNSGQPLTDDEAQALVTYYQLKILEGQRKLDALMVDVKSARDVINGHFKRMTADLKFTRQDFEREVIAKLNMTEAEFLSSEKKRARLQRLAGLAQGEQLDLIERINDTVDDEVEAEANGFRAGLRADDPNPPENLHPMFHAAFGRGWIKGQEQNASRIKVAEAVLAERAKPAIDLEDEPAEEEDDAFDPDVVAKKARELKKTGWTEPQPEEAAFAEAAA